MAASPPEPGKFTSVSERGESSFMGVETLLDYPDADIILRSHDSSDFRVPRSFINKRSPILDKLIQATPDLPTTTSSTDPDTPLPIVHMLESGMILRCLLTFMLPMQPVLPPSVEQTMELLSVAKKYEMGHILAHIRGIISLKNPPLICKSNALQVYSVAQKCGLREEVIQAARLTLKSTLTIEKLEGQLDVVPGDHLHELWRYHQRVQNSLVFNINKFRDSSAYKAMKSMNCAIRYSSGIPKWIDDYICLIARTLSSFDVFEFQCTLARHLQPFTSNDSLFSPNSVTKQCSSCTSLPRQIIDEFWTALTNFVHANMELVESAVFFSKINPRSKDSIGLSKVAPPLPECLDVSDADIVIQSSDSAKFPVRKSILSSSSQFFRDMFLLPQTSDSETIDGLPVVHFSEDGELVRALITVLYPIPPEIPTSYERVLALLAAAQKYDMSAVQSSIRAEVARRELLAPAGAQTFRAFAIAFGNKLSPEIGTTARLTLDYPLTFESLGDELRMFRGSALRELVEYRKTCRDNIISCLESFLDTNCDLSKIWIGCSKTSKAIPDPNVSHWGQTRLQPGANLWSPTPKPTLPLWLRDLFTQQSGEMKECFTHAIIKPSSIREKYLEALLKHSPNLGGCSACVMVHVQKGDRYCAELEEKLTHARNQVLDFV